MKNIRRAKGRFFTPFFQKMNSDKLFARSLCIIICILCMSLFGCGKNDEANTNADNQSDDSGFVPATPGNYDSMDRAIVAAIDQNAGTITFQTTYIGKKYTLNYDGATCFYDKYGQGIALSQIKKGEIVDVKFMKTRKRLDSLTLANDSFAYTDTDKFELSENGKRMTIGGEEYSFDNNMVVITGNGYGELMDINNVDVLSVRGVDHEIYSVVVEKGHGYIRLVNDSYFVGGWIEVSQKQICQISSDMVIAAPVGTYLVTVSNDGSTGIEQVTIEEGKEYEMDLAQYKEEAKYGQLLFTIVPETAKVYIDGSVVDTTKAVELEYGIHQMIVIADGYQTISKYIKVGTDSSSLDVVMEKDSDANDKDDQSVSSNDTVITPPTPSDNITPSDNVITPPSVSKNTPQPEDKPKDVISTAGDYKVYIDSPEGAEVYVDGSYVGVAPVSFAKKPGSIVVTLRKEGYQTRSYTLNIDSGNKDSNYSFSNLTPIG